MGIESTAESPYGTEALMVSKLLGPAYQTVKLVADNLAALVALNDNSPEIIQIGNTFVTTVIQVTAAAVNATAAASAAAISADNAEASAVSIAGLVTTAGNSAAAAAVSAAAAGTAETNAETAASAAAASALSAANIAGANFLPLTGGTVTGDTIFSGTLTVQDTAYGPGWNGSALAASRNAVYDKIETLTPLSLLGAVSGIAQLGVDQKLLPSQLPDIVVGALKYQGTWDATTNVPAIPAAAAGNKGHYYVVATAGATAIDGQNDWAIGDWIISSGVVWSKVDNSDKVSSVNGQSGAVVLTKADVGLPLVDNTADANKPVSVAQAAADALKSPIAPRKQAAGANAITPNAADDVVTRVITGAVTINNPTGVFADGQGFVIRIKGGAGAYTVTWGAKYRPVGEALPTVTVAVKMLYIPVMWYEADDKFDVFPAQQEN